MSGKIAIDKLVPHPKNDYYFTDVTGERYEEIKRSIEVSGIRDPIKITADYTIISGHQRYRIAKDIGINEVPVEIVDVDAEQAEYLLIAENIERRGEAEPDPIKKGRIAQFLREYWGVQRGRGGDRKSKDKMPLKTMGDIASTISEDIRVTTRLLKLNDLIPEIQTLVSDGKLGATAAEQMAYLTAEEQRETVSALGERVAEQTVEGMRKLRREIERYRDTERTLRDTIESLQARPPEIVEKVIEVVPPSIKRRADQLEGEREKATRYGQRIEELLNELAEAKKINGQPDDISPRSKFLMTRHTDFSRLCNELSDEMATLALDIPDDLPPPIRASYTIFVERALKTLSAVHDELTFKRSETTKDVVVIDVTH